MSHLHGTKNSLCREKIKATNRLDDTYNKRNLKERGEFFGNEVKLTTKTVLVPVVQIPTNTFCFKKEQSN